MYLLIFCLTFLLSNFSMVFPSSLFHLHRNTPQPCILFSFLPAIPSNLKFILEEAFSNTPSSPPQSTWICALKTSRWNLYSNLPDSGIFFLVTFGSLKVSYSSWHFTYEGQLMLSGILVMSSNTDLNFGFYFLLH